MTVLAHYLFKIHYMLGKINVEVDALSRIPWDEMIENEVIKAIINQSDIVFPW